MADSQKMATGYKSGGKRIDDHSFWAGKQINKESPFPMESKMKQETSADGAGELMKYEDSTEAIRAEQVESSKKVKARALKTGYRN